MLTPNDRVALSAMALGLGIALSAGDARADSVPGPDRSGCATLDAGSPCILENGAPGRCVVENDARRGRRWTSCDAIPECEVVAVGGVCHGFGGRPAHCREFRDERTRRPFRMCVADPESYAALNDASTATDPEPLPPDASVTITAPQPTPIPTPARAAGPAPVAPQRSRCSVGSIGARGSSLGALTVALGAVLLRRKRRC